MINFLTNRYNFADIGAIDFIGERFFHEIVRKRRDLDFFSFFFLFFFAKTESIDPRTFTFILSPLFFSGPRCFAVLSVVVEPRFSLQVSFRYPSASPMESFPSFWHRR